MISVLAHFYDLDRAFDRVLNRSLPYLIFPPKEFRVELGDKIGSLYQYYRETNSTAFSEQRNLIEQIITSAAFDDITERKISNFTQHQQPLDKTLSDLDERVAKLEGDRKSGFKTGRKTPYNGPLVVPGSDPDGDPREKELQQASLDTRQDLGAPGDGDPEPSFEAKSSQDQPVISRVVEFLKSHNGEHTHQEIAREVGASERGVRIAILREFESNPIKGDFIRVRKVSEHGTSVTGAQIVKKKFVYSWVKTVEPDPLGHNNNSIEGKEQPER